MANGGIPVVLSDSGLAVTFGTRGLGVSIASNGHGMPVVEVPTGGIGVVLVGAPPVDEWILALGSWDDAGVWDDAAVWID